MPRVISFIVLLAIVLLVGALFFQVMAQFMVPLFLACVLLVAFEPLHRRILEQLPRWPRIAALLTTVVILLSVLLPLVWLGWKAYVDFFKLLNRPAEVAAADGGGRREIPLRRATPPEQPVDELLDPELEVAEAADNEEIERKDQQELTAKLKEFLKPLITRLSQTTGIELSDATLNQALSMASGFAAKSAVTVVQSVVKILVGLVIMVIALYYFLADGPGMIRALMRLSPLDNRYEQELLQRFSQVSRAVVVATLLSAAVQGALAGIGYYFALPPEAPIFLLTALTMVTAMIPFFGAAAVWVLVCGWVYLHGELSTTIILAAYCTVIVSGIDNIIKPLVLHGQSNLHPLLALLSILGGVTVLGPVGILVGPMLVSFLQALLNMLRKELELFGQPDVGTGKQLAGAMAGAEEFAAEMIEGVEGELAPAKPPTKPPSNSDKSAHGSKFSRFRRKKGKR